MKKEKLLIKKGKVFDPAHRINGEVLDILVEDGIIAMVAKDINNVSARVIDARGMVVMPGLVDMHVHLREPGREDKETIESGTRAALKGAVTSVLAMPNTLPAIDNAKQVEVLKDIIKRTARANVFIAGAITQGRLGKKLTAVAELKKHGVIAITDDGASVDDAKLFLDGCKKAKAKKVLVISHCEDKSLSGSGVVNRGFFSTKLGLRGISKESEYKRVERDILIAAKAQAPIHIAHVSCAESVEIIGKAKKKGIRVTAETCPHYFSLTEEAVSSYDTNLKMNPPLRGKEDAAAIKKGLKTGVIDVIASDHAPHTINEKEIEFEYAEFGVIGLETMLAASITELIHTGILTWQELVKKMALNPAKILGIPRGTLGIKAQADIAIVDPDAIWTVRKEELISKSKNSAFLGRSLSGVVEYTICSGRLAFQAKT
jgi:dihydroorotase